MIKGYFESQYSLSDKLTLQKHKEYSNIPMFLHRVNMGIDRIYRDPQNLSKPLYLVDVLGVDMYLSTKEDPLVKQIREDFGTSVLYLFNTHIEFPTTKFVVGVTLTHILSRKALSDERLSLDLGMGELFFYKIVA